MYRWMASDEWAEQHVEALQADKRRRRRLFRERVVVPAREQLARDYADKTEQLRRWLRREAAQRRGKGAA